MLFWDPLVPWPICLKFWLGNSVTRGMFLARSENSNCIAKNPGKAGFPSYSYINRLCGILENMHFWAFSSCSQQLCVVWLYNSNIPSLTLIKIKFRYFYLASDFCIFQSCSFEFNIVKSSSHIILEYQKGFFIFAKFQFTAFPFCLKNKRKQKYASSKIFSFSSIFFWNPNSYLRKS